MLTQITPSQTARAEQVASQIIQSIITTAQRLKNIRENGVPASPERTLPNGQVVPAFDAIPWADIEAKIGPQNMAVIAALEEALG